MSARLSAGPLVALATAACVLAIAACGSGASKRTGAAGNPQLALSRCMRAHGLPNYPDPTTGPGGEGFSIAQSIGGTSNTLTVNGIPFGGPAFTAAEKACKLFGGGSAPPPISESQKLALFQFAQCMRRHGVPNYPDPVFPAGGGIERPDVPGVSRDAPAVTQASVACNKA